MSWTWQGEETPKDSVLCDLGVNSGSTLLLHVEVTAAVEGDEGGAEGDQDESEDEEVN